MRMFLANHLGEPSIEPVEVEDESPHSVCVDGVWYFRIGAVASYWPTFAEAKKHLLGKYDKCIAEASKSLSDAQHCRNIAASLQETGESS